MTKYLILACVTIFLSIQNCTIGPIAPITVFGGRTPFVEEKIVYKEKTKNKILLLEINGKIVNSSSLSLLEKTENTVAEIKYRLDKARSDPNIKGIILMINSPGGGVTATDLIYYELMKFKKAKNIPIVAWFVNVAASGGVYIAMSADKIVAHPTCITGSIGVIATFPSIGGMLRWFGLKMNIIKSGKHKDIGSLFKAMSDEERAIFQRLIDQMYNRFFNIVYESRKKTGLSKEELKEVADGRVFSASDAKKYKLIDEIGYFDQVFLLAKDIAKVDKANLVSYTYIANRKSNIYVSETYNNSKVKSDNVKDILGLDNNLSPKFLYMWMPW